jgi:NAD+ synthase (glutamine-hydrolysing)
MATNLRVGLAQIVTRLGDVQGNRDRIIASLERGKKEDVHIVLFPELSTLGYGSGDIYLDKVEDNLAALDEIREATKTLGLFAVLGYVEKDNLGFFYNSAALLGNGEHLGTYRKVQLVNYRLFDEKRYFKRGSRLPVFETPFGRLGILICEDVWFPEPARALTFRGAEVILVLNSSPFDRGKVERWREILTMRVYDNLLPIAFVNAAGVQDGVTYWGGSMVVSAAGDLIACGALMEEDFVVCDIDIDESKRLRRRDIRVREVRREILQELLRAYEEMME